MEDILEIRRLLESRRTLQLDHKLPSLMTLKAFRLRLHVSLLPRFTLEELTLARTTFADTKLVGDAAGGS